MSFMEVAKEFGWAVAIFLTLVVLLQNQIKSLVGRWVNLGAKRAEKSIDFDEAMRKRTLSNGEYSKELVHRLLEQADTERIERRAANAVVLEQARTTEKLAVEAVSVMKDFADIARLTLDNQRAYNQELCGTLKKMNVTMQGIGILLAQLSQANNQGVPFDELLESIERKEPGSE